MTGTFDHFSNHCHFLWQDCVVIGSDTLVTTVIEEKVVIKMDFDNKEREKIKVVKIGDCTW